MITDKNDKAPYLSRIAREMISLAMHPAILTAILATLLSVVWFNAFAGDSLKEHLPFSVRFWNIPGYPQSSEYMLGRYSGFPIVGRMLMGPGLALYAPRLLMLPNLIALAILCGCCKRILGISRAMTICCCLCFPVVFYGFGSSMQDFFVNAMVMSAAICLFTPKDTSRGLSVVQPHIERRDIFALAMLALASNTKFQGLFMASVVIFVAVATRFILPAFRQLRVPMEKTIVTDYSVASRHYRMRWIAAVFILFLVYAQPVVNILRFSNPFYPVEAFGMPGTEKTYNTPVQYLPKIPVVYNYASFLSSALEIDPVIRSERGFRFKRSYHSRNIPKEEFKEPDNFGNMWILTGGSNGILYLLLLVGAIIGVIAIPRSTSGLNSAVIIANRRLMLSALIVCLLPQSIELRYYMYTLFVPALIAVNTPLLRLNKLMRLIVVAGLWILLASVIFEPLYFWSRTGKRLDDAISMDAYRGLPSEQECLSCGKLEDSAKSGKKELIMTDYGKAFQCQLRFGRRLSVKYFPSSTRSK